MAAVTRNDMNAGVLQTWLLRQTLEVFEPNLYFYRLGEQPMVQEGYNTVSWAKFDKVAESSVTEGTTSNDGVTPSDTAFNATVVTATPKQYRIVITLSDMVVELNVIGFLSGAAKAVGAAMARKIDSVIQTEVMGGSNVIYGGTGNLIRSDLASGDIITASLFNRGSALLAAADAPTIDGMYVAVLHPFHLFDLRADTAAGGWLDVAKYANPQQVFKGEIGALFGVRIIVSSHVQKFTSTVPVYPCLILGKGAYGVSDFQTMKTYVTPAVASDSDPLAQRRKVGAKVAFVPKRLQEDAMQRIEVAVTLDPTN